MSSFDDELALFESEISSIMSDAPAAELVNVQKTSVAHSAAPSRPPVFPPTVAPVIIGAPLLRPSMSSVIAPPFMSRPHMGMMPPMPPPLFMGQNGFIPHQLRMPPMHRPSATIESGPSIYSDETSSAQTGVLQTKALAADVLAMETKKITDSMKANAASAKADGKKKKFIRSGGGQVWEDASLAEWDPNDFRIFCGDLGNEVSDELLGKAFRKYNSFQRAKVVRDSRSNKSKGYGFVSFKDAEDYARAMREMDGKYVGNRPIKLRKSAWKDRQLDVIKRKQKQKEKLGMWS